MKLARFQRLVVQRNSVVFLATSQRGQPIVLTLPEMRRWHRESEGRRLQRFLAGGGKVRRIK